MPIDKKNTAKEAYNVLVAGGLCLMPSDAGYVLLGHSTPAIKKIYTLKDRPLTIPCMVMANLEMLEDLTEAVDKNLLQWLSLITRFTPLTVVFPIRKTSHILRSLSTWVYHQATENDTVAVFLNSGAVVDEMAKLAYRDSFALIVSSGNTSNAGNNFRLQDIPKKIRDKVDYTAESGTMKYVNLDKCATTIINLVNFTVTREGINNEIITSEYNRFAAEHGLIKLS